MVELVAWLLLNRDGSFDRISHLNLDHLIVNDWADVEGERELVKSVFLPKTKTRVGLRDRKEHVRLFVNMEAAMWMGR